MNDKPYRTARRHGKSRPAPLPVPHVDERDGQRDERRDGGRGDWATSGTASKTERKSHIRMMEIMRINYDSIDFPIEYIYIKL